jgi:phosphoribosylanthranilate isomerase
MKVKICGLFREQDIEYVNEALPDYAGFVFAPSKRQVSGELARELRSNLAGGIVPVGVFVNAPIEEIATLYRDGVISIAQLHGDEDESYISTLKEVCDIPIIKTLKFTTENAEITERKVEYDNFASANQRFDAPSAFYNSFIDYLLLDSGSGTGKTFDWNLLKTLKLEKPWFLAGGINLDNIEQAMAFNPYAVDISSGAETSSPSEPGGFKDREKILQLVTTIKKGNIK